MPPFIRVRLYYTHVTNNDPGLTLSDDHPRAQVSPSSRWYQTRPFVFIANFLDHVRQNTRRIARLERRLNDLENRDSRSEACTGHVELRHIRFPIQETH